MPVDLTNLALHDHLGKQSFFCNNPLKDFPISSSQQSVNNLLSFIVTFCVVCIDDSQIEGESDFDDPLLLKPFVIFTLKEIM